MLTTKTAQVLYSKLTLYSAVTLRAKIDLVAKCALTVYRKCGKVEAETFITLLRVAMLVD